MILNYIQGINFSRTSPAKCIIDWWVINFGVNFSQTLQSTTWLNISGYVLIESCTIKNHPKLWEEHIELISKTLLISTFDARTLFFGQQMITSNAVIWVLKWSFLTRLIQWYTWKMSSGLQKGTYLNLPKHIILSIFNKLNAMYEIFKWFNTTK